MSVPLTAHSKPVQLFTSTRTITASAPSDQHRQVPLTCWCLHKLAWMASGAFVLVFLHLFTDLLLTESLLLRYCKHVHSWGSWTTQRWLTGWKGRDNRHFNMLGIQTRYISTWYSSACLRSILLPFPTPHLFYFTQSSLKHSLLHLLPLQRHTITSGIKMGIQKLELYWIYKSIPTAWEQLTSEAGC